MAGEIDFRLLKSFQAAAEELHFGRASEIVGTTPGNLSQHISSLEEFYGAKLFERHTRQVNLTAAGKALHKRTNKILLDVKQSVDAVRSACVREANTLNIGVSSSATFGKYVDIARQFSEQYGGVELRFHRKNKMDQLDALRAGTIDIGFCRNIPVVSPIQSMLIEQDGHLCVMRQDHPLAGEDVVDIGDLLWENFVGFSQENMPTLSEFYKRLCNNAGFEPKICHEADDLAMIQYLVETGGFIALCPASSAAIKSYGLVYKPVVNTCCPLESYVLWNQAKMTGPSILFIGFVRACLQRFD